MSSFLSQNKQPANAGWKCGVVQILLSSFILYGCQDY
jgi:hypothetical protein